MNWIVVVGVIGLDLVVAWRRKSLPFLLLIPMMIASLLLIAYFFVYGKINNK